MKTVTLKEFVEMVKNDEQLQGRIKEAVGKREGQLTSEFTRIAAEAGYELKKEEPLDMEVLSDDDLADVAGGADGSDDALYDSACYFLADIIGFDPALCD